MPKPVHISAVIPSYNRQKTINRAIDSALNQEYTPSEIIVIDDGSTDNTRELLREYRGKIRYIYQKNGGVSSARNRGVLEARYDWIAFLDSDDYWEDRHLRRIVDAIEATEGKAYIYFSNIKRTPEEGGFLQWDLCNFKVGDRYEFIKDASDWAMMTRQPMMLQASVIRRKNYLEVGGISEDLVTREDTLLFYRLCFGNPACAVAGCGTIMTSSSDRTSRLTIKYSSHTAVYWDCTILLYKRTLLYTQRLPPRFRKAILERLNKAYIFLSLVHYRKKNLSLMLKSIISATRNNPLLCAINIITLIKDRRKF